MDRNKFTRYKDFIFRPEDVDGVIHEKDPTGDDFHTYVYFKGHCHSFKDNDRTMFDYFDSILINKQLKDDGIGMNDRKSTKIQNRE